MDLSKAFDYLPHDVWLSIKNYMDNMDLPLINLNKATWKIENKVLSLGQV